MSVPMTLIDRLSVTSINRGVTLKRMRGHFFLVDLR